MIKPSAQLLAEALRDEGGGSLAGGKGGSAPVMEREREREREGERGEDSNDGRGGGVAGGVGGRLGDTKRDDDVERGDVPPPPPSEEMEEDAEVQGGADAP